MLKAKGKKNLRTHKGKRVLQGDPGTGDSINASMAGAKQTTQAREEGQKGLRQKIWQNKANRDLSWSICPMKGEKNERR